MAVCFGCPTINCIPVLDPDSKRTLVYIAYDKDSVQDLSFYATLSNPLPSVHERPKNPSETDFSASCWDHIRLGAVDDDKQLDQDQEQPNNFPPAKLQEELCDKVAQDIKKRLRTESDALFQESINKFTLGRG